jgi:alpha-glucosidase
MPWEAGRPSYGFGPSDQTWLPQPAAYGDLAVDRQTGAAGSTLELYRALLGIRRAHGLGSGSLSLIEGYSEDVVALVNESAAGERVVVITNLGAEPVAVPGGALGLVSSGPLTSNGMVPTDTTVWLTA